MTVEIKSTTTSESPNAVRNFLAGQDIGVVSTVNEGGQPFGAAVYFSLEDDLSLVFSTKTETQKYQNIAKNKLVAFTVFSEEEQTTVQITGRVEIIENEERRRKAVNDMFTYSATRGEGEVPPVDKLYAGDYITLRLVPSTIKLAVYARSVSEGDDIYEVIEFREG